MFSEQLTLLGLSWSYIKSLFSSAAGNLQSMVMGMIRDWVLTRVVTSAVTKLISMFNPAGAIIQAAMGIYNVVMFFIERAQQIAALVQSITCVL